MSVSITTRLADINDCAALAHIHVAGWRAAYGGMVDDEYLAGLREDEFATKWQSWLNEGTAPLLAIDEATKTPVGFVSYGKVRTAPPGSSPIRPPYTAEIYAIYILPDFWRIGIGTRLLKKSVANLYENKHKSLCLWVVDKNKRAVSFYKKYGGQKCGKQQIEIGPSSVQEICFGWRNTDQMIGDMPLKNNSGKS